jgi:hypothetical protein
MLVRAVRSWSDPSGVEVAAGQVFEDTDPVVRGRSHMFVPADVPPAVVPVEQATAAPGEVRRSTRKPRP